MIPTYGINPPPTDGAVVTDHVRIHPRWCYVIPTIGIRRVHRILARVGQDFASSAKNVFLPPPGCFLPPPPNCFFFQTVNNAIKIHQKDYTFGVTEVRTRSKILTPLETTGGNTFSLEEFEKMLFTI